MNDLQELGSVLYRARTELNLSIDDLEQQTKIRSRFLRAIEEGRFDEIPGEVYLKGFLRSYARAVELDAEQVLIQYYQLAGEAKNSPKKQPEPVVSHQPTPSRAGLSRRQRRARQRRQQRVIALVTLLLLLALGVAFLSWNDLGFF